MTPQITLQWQGPFSLATPGDRSQFRPPPEPGVYLWAVREAVSYRIAYVGEAADLRTRFCQHVTWILGGGYKLYADPVRDPARYIPKWDNFFETYLNQFDELSRLAYENAIAYSFFWAGLVGSAQMRKSVESALISAAKKRGEAIQNVAPSRGPGRALKLCITSVFPAGVPLPAIDKIMFYGTLAPVAV